MTDQDRIAELFGSLSEQSPGVYTSPVGLTPDELTNLAENMVAKANQDGKLPLPEEIENAGLPFNEDLQKKPSSYTHGLPGLDHLENLQRIQRVEEVVAGEPGPRNDPDYPDRPQHEDFWKMSELVRRTDAIADRTNASRMDIVDLLILGGVDPDSVRYMARQRVARATTQIPFPDSAQDRSAEGFACWMDGFLLGHQLAKANAPQIHQLLDESIDGQRRQRGADSA